MVLTPDASQCWGQVKLLWRFTRSGGYLKYLRLRLVSTREKTCEHWLICIVILHYIDETSWNCKLLVLVIDRQLFLFVSIWNQSLRWSGSCPPKRAGTDGCCTRKETFQIPLAIWQDWVYLKKNIWILDLNLTLIWTIIIHIEISHRTYHITVNWCILQ
jgi:hypothetical protein